jgi:hypothetical protein
LSPGDCSFGCLGAVAVMLLLPVRECALRSRRELAGYTFAPHDQHDNFLEGCVRV